MSLYGLLDERSDASVHRSISDLTPLLSDPRYNELLLLGGDLNPLWSVQVGRMALSRVQGVFDRIIDGFGLKDLLQRTLSKQDPPRGRLENCTRSIEDECTHVRSFRTGMTATDACQDDYLFASPALEERLAECLAVDFAEDSPSDDVPVVATFSGFEETL